MRRAEVAKRRRSDIVRNVGRGGGAWGERGRGLIRPVVFLVFVGAGIAAVAGLLKPAPDGDVFAPLGLRELVDLSGLGFPGVYAAKKAHGLLAPRHDVGLFGNSRSLMVAAADVGLTDAAFFNFSVISGSFRASVLLLEELAAAGKAPRLAIISLDHLELQEDNNPAIAGIAPRVALAVDDAVVGLVHPRIGWAEAGRMAWRHFYGAIRDLGRILNFRRLVLGLRARVGALPIASWLGPASGPSEPGFRRDGSVAFPEIAQPAIPVSAPQPALYILGYLDADLERVAALRDLGTRVVIYESLLDPVNAAHVAAHPNQAAVAARNRWLRACRRLALECHRFAAEAMPSMVGAWTDASHPPAALLGRYVRRLIQPPMASD